jgi:hypothetical protein
MTVEDARKLKSGMLIRDNYFNRRGEVFAPDEKGFMVKYEDGQTEDVEFINKNTLDDLEKIDSD